VELKRLELFGFKSFADRTRFEFDSGVTVIVGPNGCGKSNVVDAVKWVLGEQSPKSLRGREMADVIFAGSESRRSLGFAEATLTFDNSRGLLPIDVAEVEVSRRLYRSGESEYLLNRKPCRLRDIRELFMGTGIGVDAYSLIEQGKVDVLLQSNPEERRIIFEEAAGISKYKAKRREAERKLQRTEQNLLRLGDILEEVERRLRSVKYQAGKARSYKEYSARLKDLRVSYALNQYHEQVTALAARLSEIDGLAAERSARSARLAQLDQERSAIESQLMDLERDARAADARMNEIRSGIAMRDSEVGFHRTRVGELGQVVERDRRKTGDLSAHLKTAEAAVESRRAEVDSVAESAARQEGVVAEVEARLRDVSDRLRDLTGRIDQAKTAMMDLAQERTQRASRAASIELRLETLEGQVRRLHARQGEIAAGLQQSATREAEARAELAALDAAITERRGRLEAKRHEAEAKQTEVEQVGERLARAKEDASGLDSRREVLEDLQRRGEGIPAAVRQVAEAIAARGWAERWRGMVADLIEVDVAHAVVVEAALGPAEKMLIADHKADVLALARELDAKLPGQVRFLALDAVGPAPRSAHVTSVAGEGVPLAACSQCAQPETLADKPPVAPGAPPLSEPAAGAAGDPAPVPALVPDLAAHPLAVGWAIDYVRAADAVRPAIAHLLARTIVVRTLEDAVELARGTLCGYRFVSRSGSILEPDGSVAVGPPGSEMSLISRRSQLRDILRDREALGLAIDGLQAARLRAVEELGAMDDAQQQLRQEIYEGSMRKVEVEGQLRRVADTRGALEAEAPVIEAELAQFAAERGQMAAERDGLRHEIGDLQRREAEHLAVIGAMVGEQDELGRARDAREEDRTQSRILLAQLREKHAALVDQVAAAERDLASTRDGIREARADVDQCLQRIGESDRTMLRLQSELAALFLDKEATEREVRRLAGERAERRDAVSDLSEKARQVESEIDELQQRVHGLELQGRELQTKRDDLLQRVRDDFAVDLAERHAGWQPDQVDWNAVADEIRELQGKIERLGAVNLEAIDEQEALQQRTSLLRQQRDDLVKAREALGNLIDRINRESRERFLTTFAAVRTNFQELFRKLFAGGKADVFLENEADVLESGIEVVARPPGKQLQRISLLSGGEKTMTAVALLLAIFRARPSPFAILDEVDAALDESNVGRFTELVKQFLDQSQFVIISHNKRTMAIADVLYGVTMAEPGVSRKVSVKFSDLREQGYELGAPQDVKGETDAAEPVAGKEPAWSTDDESDAEPAATDDSLAPREYTGGGPAQKQPIAAEADADAEPARMPVEAEAALSAPRVRAARKAEPADEQAEPAAESPAPDAAAGSPAPAEVPESVK